MARMVAQLAEEAEVNPGASKFVIPQREFAMFQDEDIEKIEEIFIDWLEHIANMQGRGWNPR
jgi:phage gpG-like protein